MKPEEIDALLRTLDDGIKELNIHSSSSIVRAAALIRELRADSERLDWVEETKTDVYRDGGGWSIERDTPEDFKNQEVKVFISQRKGPVRAAIDAARTAEEASGMKCGVCGADLDACENNYEKFGVHLRAAEKGEE